MATNVVFMFSGQGSQYYQMGRELYQENSRFRQWMDFCDSLAAPELGQSLIDILYENGPSSEPFDTLRYSNPALLSVEYSLARVLMEQGVQPNYVLGYSLGEFTAAVISGAMPIAQCMSVLINYAEFMEAQSPPAGMLAILANEKIVADNPQLFEKCWVTGSNFDGHFVVSGPDNAITLLQHALKDRSVLAQRLPVKFGFHTPMMDTEQAEFLYKASDIAFGRPFIPMISCTSGFIDSVDSHHLWQAIRQPVKFQPVIQQVLSKLGECCFIDVGPSGTLATFVKYLLPRDTGSSHFEVINQYGKNVVSVNRMLENFRNTQRVVPA